MTAQIKWGTLSKSRIMKFEASAYIEGIHLLAMTKTSERSE